MEAGRDSPTSGFAAARAFGAARSRRGAQRAVLAAFPRAPEPGPAGRDFASFSAEQRSLTMELLLAGDASAWR